MKPLWPGRGVGNIIVGNTHTQTEFKLETKSGEKPKHKEL